MKGLMYNVLEALANRSGCSEEAWELVVEFAAAEALLDNASSTSRVAESKSRLSYASPAEAMIKCLSQERSTGVPSALAPLPDSAEPTLTFVECARSEDLRPSFGFSAEAFLCPEALLEAWDDDWDVPSDEDENRGYWTNRLTQEKKRRAE